MTDFSYIAAAYAATGIILASLILRTWLRNRKLKRLEKELQP